jgi:hypothetical protein
MSKETRIITCFSYRAQGLAAARKMLQMWVSLQLPTT